MEFLRWKEDGIKWVFEYEEFEVIQQDWNLLVDSKNVLNIGLLFLMQSSFCPRAD